MEIVIQDIARGSHPAMLAKMGNRRPLLRDITARFTQHYRVVSANGERLPYVSDQDLEQLWKDLPWRGMTGKLPQVVTLEWSEAFPGRLQVLSRDSRSNAIDYALPKSTLSFSTRVFGNLLQEYYRALTATA